MAITLAISPTTDDLFGKSKWWGAPDLPKSWDYPCYQECPLNFICQIRCEDLAEVDKDNLLPHTGMLYFFASLGEFLEGFECDVDSCYSGEWAKEAYRVLYSPSCDDLETYEILWDDDDTPAHLPAEQIEFHYVEMPTGDYHKLLGQPYFSEVQEYYPNHISLLQIDEDDRWRLRFVDCGMLNFLITPEQLKAREWDKAFAHLYFF